MNEYPICALCKKNEANKTNTHYLTDYLVKQALNEDGTNKRDRTTAFKYTSTGMETNFKGTSNEGIKDLLGRDANDKEINDWKNTLFLSRDHVFCKDCENLFGCIENDFTPKVLSKLRPSFFNKAEDDLLDDVTGDNSSIKFSDKEAIIIHLFFYIQIWRSHICDKDMRICHENTIEKLRDIILNYKNAEIKDIKDIPLTINYLKTPSRKAYTCNVVGKFSNNCLILNDFQIFVEEANQGNQDGFEFSITIFSNEKREKIIMDIARVIAPQHLRKSVDDFTKAWREIKKSEPSPTLIQEYRNSYCFFMSNLPKGLQNTKEKIREHLSLFLNKKNR